MIRYINTKQNGSVETIDFLDSNDFETNQEFRKELKRLINEYLIAGITCYTSQRKAK
jgi:hypothetical protein